MKKNKIIYWTTTVIVSSMMLFSAVQYLTNPQMGQAFKHLGFSDNFRVELAIAKIIGAVVLLIPAIPARIKEWAYAGFAIVFLSASIAHFTSGDTPGMVITPFFFLVILAVSNVYLHKLKTIAPIMMPSA
jgi:cobalamin synthase